MKKNILTIFIPILLFSCIFILPVQAGVFDEIGNNLQIFTGAAGLTKADNPIDIVVGIINIILGFLSLIFIVLVIYGGFKYMTAGGSAENTKKAVGIIKDAAIGVAIVLLSGVLVNFVFANIIKAISGTPAI